MDDWFQLLKVYQWGIWTGGNFWDYYPGTLSSWTSQYNSFEDRVPNLQMSCTDLI